MILARIYKNKSGGVCGFRIESHGNKIVCAAVSALALNTVNCIEKFTGDAFTCDHNPSGGYMDFLHTGLAANDEAHDASLLLEALHTGLDGIHEQYNKDITITTEVYHVKN